MTAANLSVQRNRRQGLRPRQIALSTIRIAAILVLLFATMVPLVWVVVTAFKPNAEVLTLPIEVLPRQWTGEHFSEVFSWSGSLRFLFNSLVATLGSTALVVAIATPAAYALARHRFMANAGEGAGLLVLAARFIPVFVVIIPLFLVFRDLRLLDNLFGLILAYTVMNLPLAVWVILPSARQLPQEITEAAAVDGASVGRTFFQVSLPLLGPSIATAATLCMIFAWNEFFTALIFTQSKAQTAPLLISRFLGDFGIQWGTLAANSLVVVIPMVVLGIAAQKHLVRGLTAGSVK